MHDDPVAEDAIPDQPVGGLVGGVGGHAGEANRAAPAGLDEAIAALERWGWERDWRGSDPYEGLNARRPRLLTGHPLGRRILIQAVKRSPLDLRPALGIEPTENAAAIAHALAGYARLAAGDEGFRPRAAWAVERLAALRAPAYAEPAWCYPFDVESRVFFYPATTPNTIATAFAGLALLDAGELATATGAGEFFLERVGLTQAEEGAFFGYFPGDHTPIHNASMLAAGLLARLAAATGRDDFADAAGAAVRYAVSRQRPDGSWPYGEIPGLGWVDGFHTGYVLDSLLRCAEGLGDDAAAAAWERGMAYYRERLFLADGTPKYYAEGVYPIDSQSVAQALSSFALGAGRDPSLLGEAERVLGFALDRMRRDDGSFVFQRRRRWTNRAPHVRWVQAPMLDGLTALRARYGGSA